MTFQIKKFNNYLLIIHLFLLIYSLISISITSCSDVPANIEPIIDWYDIYNDLKKNHKVGDEVDYVTVFKILLNQVFSINHFPNLFHPNVENLINSNQSFNKKLLVFLALFKELKKFENYFCQISTIFKEYFEDRIIINNFALRGEVLLIYPCFYESL